MTEVISLDDLAPATSDNTDGLALLDTNWQTTAAVGLTVATGGVTGAIMLAAFPAQTLAAAGGIGALAYAGQRRADGKPAFPFLKDFGKDNSVPSPESVGRNAAEAVA